MLKANSEWPNNTTPFAHGNCILLLSLFFKICYCFLFLYLTAVDCGPLPLLLNGTYLGNLTTYPNEVLSFCDEGFLLRGSARRFCQANRTWSGIQTTCAGKEIWGVFDQEAEGKKKFCEDLDNRPSDFAILRSAHWASGNSLMRPHLGPWRSWQFLRDFWNNFLFYIQRPSFILHGTFLDAISMQGACS